MEFDEGGLVVLGSLGLLDEAIAGRRGFVNASEVPEILYGDPESRRALAEFHLGGPPKDLSDRLPVQLGSYTEPFNLAWMSAQTGLKVQRTHLVRVSDRLPWLRATLDGWLPELGIHVEAKHTNPFAKAEEVVRWYQGQLQAQMFCAGTTQAKLSVIFGNSSWVMYDVQFDPFWWEDVEPLLSRWHAQLAAGINPEPVPEPAPPPPEPDKMIEVDMTTSNSWATHAETLVRHHAAAALFDTAKDEIKKLVPPNARRAYGHGVEITRDKRGAKAVRMMPEGDDGSVDPKPRNPTRRRGVVPAAAEGEAP